MNSYYDLVVSPNTTLIITEDVKNKSLSPGTPLRIRNKYGTVYWDVLGENGEKHATVTDHILRNWLLRSKTITCVNAGDATRLLNEVRFSKFSLLPNRDLKKAFVRFATKEEYTEHNKALFERYPDGVRYAPLEEQLLYISWPQSRWGDEDTWGTDLGDFKTAYAVELSKELRETCNRMTPNQGFYLGVVELDDRYRFFVKYDHIIGNKWLFENFKNTKWEN